MPSLHAPAEGGVQLRSALTACTSRGWSTTEECSYFNIPHNDCLPVSPADQPAAVKVQTPHHTHVAPQCVEQQPAEGPHTHQAVARATHNVPVIDLQTVLQQGEGKGRGEGEGGGEGEGWVRGGGGEGWGRGEGGEGKGRGGGGEGEGREGVGGRALSCAPTTSSLLPSRVSTS